MMDSRPVAASDIDGTLFRRLTIEVLTQAFIDHGIFPHTFRRRFDRLCRQLRDRQIGYADYSNELVDLYVRGMAGARRRDVTRVSKLVARKYRDYVYAFTRAFLANLRETHELVAITGSNEHIIRHLAPAWGFHTWYCSEFVIDGERYTGEVGALPVKDKGAALEVHLERTDKTLQGSIGIGNSASDISMLCSVDAAIAFNPDYELMRVARYNNWIIVREKTDVITVADGSDSEDFFPTTEGGAIVAASAARAYAKQRIAALVP